MHPIAQKDSRTPCTCIKKSIGTHDGRFHCDEVLACFMLKLLPEFSDALIIRTRDEEVLKTCDIVVDVGGLYDPSNLRFDHHQRSFEETMSSLSPGSPFTTKLSSAGLIYHHYGRAVLAQILDKKQSDEIVDQLYDKIYENFIEEVDAVDNGIPLNEFPMRYRITSTIAHRVSALNPKATDPNTDESHLFHKALDLVGNEFKEKVYSYAGDYLEAFSLVKNAVITRFEVDPSGEILLLPNGGCSWKDHLSKLEGELEIEGQIKYVIFINKKGTWKIRAVPVSPTSFILRTPLKAEWQGLRNKELEEISGIPNATYVHANGFVGGAVDREAVLQMARVSLGI